MEKFTPGEYCRTGCSVYALNSHGFNRFYAQVQPGQTGERDALRKLQADVAQT